MTGHDAPSLSAWATRTLCMLLLVVAPATLAESVAPSHHLMLWQVKGRHNTVYLLGSVHMLREQDFPLPKAMDLAYDDAERLVMELDMDDLDPVAMQTRMISRAHAAEGTTLASMLGESAYATASDFAARLGTDLAMLNSVEPWFAAMTILNLQMIKQGFRTAAGIEAYFSSKAACDGKEITGLETLDRQIDVFDAMPIATQRAFLLKTLEDALTMNERVDVLIGAWRSGDVETLEHLMKKEFAATPSLYEELVVRRNRGWAQQIRTMLQESDDYLVIVGALHLVGDQGVPALLRQAGYAAAR